MFIKAFGVMVSRVALCYRCNPKGMIRPHYC
jgi:hypothetical protein